MSFDLDQLEQLDPSRTNVVRDQDIRECTGDGWIHEGSLAITGNLDVGDGTLLVVGDLAVTGEVTTDETGGLIVTGNLTCAHLYLEGNIEVHGETRVGGALYGFYEAGISRFHGPTRARLALLGNHDYEFEGPTDFEIHGEFSNYDELMTGDPDAIRVAMGDKNFSEIASMLGISDDEPDDGDAAWNLSLFADVTPRTY